MFGAPKQFGTANPFGQQPQTTPSAFGKTTSAFGQPAFGQQNTSLFGSPQPQAGIFGSQAAPGFGATAAPAFGQTAPAQPAFGCELKHAPSIQFINFLLFRSVIRSSATADLAVRPKSTAQHISLRPDFDIRIRRSKDRRVWIRGHPAHITVRATSDIDDERRLRHEYLRQHDSLGLRAAAAGHGIERHGHREVPAALWNRYPREKRPNEQRQHSAALHHCDERVRAQKFGGTALGRLLSESQGAASGLRATQWRHVRIDGAFVGHVWCASVSAVVRPLRATAADQHARRLRCATNIHLRRSTIRVRPKPSFCVPVVEPIRKTGGNRIRSNSACFRSGPAGGSGWPVRQFVRCASDVSKH